MVFLVFYLSFFFDVVFYLLPEPLGVDFELPNRPPLKNVDFMATGTLFLKNHHFRSKNQP